MNPGAATLMHGKVLAVSIQKSRVSIKRYCNQNIK